MYRKMDDKRVPVKPEPRKRGTPRKPNKRSTPHKRVSYVGMVTRTIVDASDHPYGGKCVGDWHSGQ